MNGRSEKVRSLYTQAVLAKIPLAISSICMHELWYGVQKSSQQGRNEWKLRAFIADDIEVLDFSNEDARAAVDDVVAVGELQSRGDALDNPLRFRGRQTAEVRRQQAPLERLAGEILHGHEYGLPVAIAVNDSNDVGVR